MIKTIDDITIMGNDENFIIRNKKNNSDVTINTKKDKITYCDSFDNYMLNHSATLSLSLEVFKLTEKGQVINRDNGTMIAYLSGKDVKELAEKNFYEEGQTRVYDFINLKFNIEL